jgi:TolB-like protein/DNA-binding winged helix-turn-helix (wHTH) protein/Tfp pilus assembly protein PilF
MSTSRQYLFGEFRLDAVQRALFRKDELVQLAPKALETLLFLVERHGQIVDKKELMDAVWPGTFVEEVGLARNVSVLRKVLSDHQDEQSFIETIPKRGYRFAAPVIEQQPQDRTLERVENVLQQHSRTSALRRSLAWAIPIGLILLFATVYLSWNRFFQPSSLASRRTMLAVLPVQNLTGDPSLEYISDGLTEEIIAELCILNPSRLGVIARTSSMVYKKTDKTVDRIGRELGVDYVLETSVRQSPSGLRITTQLIRTRDQTHLWAENYDRALGDILTLQSDVARQVAYRTSMNLEPRAQAKLSAAQAVKPEVYDAYLKGRFFWNKRTPEAMTNAEGFFQKAIQADPGYAPAYAGLADCYQVMVNVDQLKIDKGFAQARMAAQKALELDGTLAEAHTSMASIKEDFDWDWQGAEAEYKQALEFNPNYATAHHWYSNFLAGLGRFDQTIAELKRAQELDPLSPVIDVDLGQAYCLAGNCDRGIEQLKKTLEIYPDFAEAHGALSEMYAHQGMYDQYFAEQEKEDKLTPSRLHRRWLSAYALAKAGRKQEALAVLRQFEKIQPSPQHRDYAIAVIYAGLGEDEQAFERLERARMSHDPWMAYFRGDMKLDSLRSSSHYDELIRRMNMPL